MNIIPPGMPSSNIRQGACLDGAGVPTSSVRGAQAQGVASQQLRHNNPLWQSLTGIATPTNVSPASSFSAVDTDSTGMRRFYDGLLLETGGYFKLENGAMLNSETADVR